VPVARSVPAGRLDDLVAVALQVFCCRGYERTQMADVARVLGVAPGTLYRYVESKEALFHLVIDRALREGPLPEPEQLPLPTPSPGATERRLRQRIAEAIEFPRLEQALERKRTSDPRRELEGVVREFYKRSAELRLGADLIERSAHERPELAKLWLREARKAVFERLTLYVSRRVEQGHFRRVPDPAVATRLIVETVSWFARHRHRDPDADFDERVAQDTVLEFVLSTLAPEKAAP